MEFKPRILVVEDDLSMLKLLGEALRSMEAEPVLVPSGVHAAELVEQEKFDGVFLDWHMPDLDGLELARHIRKTKTNGKVPIVMLTGAVEPNALKQSFSAGVNYFFQKPVSLDKLRHLLNASRGQMLAERRRHQRVAITIPVFCRWEKDARAGNIVNLSASAALVALMDPPAAGTRVTLEFELPGERKSLSVAADVYRISPGPGDGGVPRVALEFIHRTQAERQVLADFVEKMLEQVEIS